MRVLIKNEIGENCITVTDGERIFQTIHKILSERKTVVLDFTGVLVFASPFFNSAIGQLLKDISLENLKRNLKIVSISPHGSAILERVIENSNLYYSDKKYRKNLDKILMEISSEH